MRVRFELLRRADSAAEPRLQRVWFETDDETATVATALTEMNRTPGLTDADGAPVGHIHWACSCLQKKCGACAMRVNGVPALACDSPLKAAPGGVIRLEPLRKFPVVADLVVDRAVLYENLKAMALWLDGPVRPGERATEVAYEASRCLQCGCCLEICPNFMPGGTFAGMAAMATAARLLAELPADRQAALRRAYRRRVYEGCGKSLACRDICPAGLDMERLLVNSNAVAVWKRLLRERGGDAGL